MEQLDDTGKNHKSSCDVRRCSGMVRKTGSKKGALGRAGNAILDHKDQNLALSEDTLSGSGLEHLTCLVAV